jgi:hypothetical protein
MAYHQLHAGHLDLWLLALYFCFVLFLFNRARRLKSRVAEMLDVAAYRAGLQRIPRATTHANTAAAKIATPAAAS